MSGLLAAAMAIVVAYCLVQALVPALHDEEHRRDLDLWHVVMGAAMAAMLLVTWSRAASLLALVVFAIGLTWAAVRLAGPRGRASYLRLGVGCAAMIAMVLPASTATAAEPPMGQHAGHSMTPGPASLLPPTALVWALLAALAVILVARLATSVRRTSSASGRLAACCDVAMAAAMGWMLVTML